MEIGSRDEVMIDVLRQCCKYYFVFMFGRADEIATAGRFNLPPEAD